MMIIIPFMRYAANHKEKTRGRIVRAAGRLLRRDGLEGPGVAQMMKRAGLTHGGFYAHFRGRAALAAAVMADAEAALAPLRRAVAELTAAGRPHALVLIYLSRWHVEHPDSGCMLASLGGELARAPKAVRAAFAAALPRYLAVVSELAFGCPDDPRSLPLLSALAGALQLARAVPDAAESDRLRRAARRSIVTAFYPDPPAP